MTKNKYTNLLLQTLGCFISAAGIYSFAVAAEVPVTGIAGICAILYRLFGIPMGLSNVLINIPIILCTYKLLGRSFFIRSVYCMVLFAIFTDYLLPLMPVYQGDRLLATICGGVVGGIGDALIYMNNSSTGALTSSPWASRHGIRTCRSATSRLRRRWRSSCSTVRCSRMLIPLFTVSCLILSCLLSSTR